MTQRNFSFEFFPPRTPEGREKLRATWQALGVLKPKFFSVTFGAGGSTQAGTLETVVQIRRDGFDAAPHISCVASTRAEIASILDQYKANGIRHIIALRGDLPSGVAMAGELRYASELVAFIRAFRYFAVDRQVLEDDESRRYGGANQHSFQRDGHVLALFLLLKPGSAV
jgi:methylenetetrahydrofolate reductase (NADPH)